MIGNQHYENQRRLVDSSYPSVESHRSHELMNIKNVKAFDRAPVQLAALGEPCGLPGLPQGGFKAFVHGNGKNQVMGVQRFGARDS